MKLSKRTLAGELRLRSYGQHEGNYRLGVSLPRLEQHELSFQGKDMLGAAEAEATPDEAASAMAEAYTDWLRTAG